jgi:hypothetical protein
MGGTKQVFIGVVLSNWNDVDKYISQTVRLWHDRCIREMCVSSPYFAMVDADDDRVFG